MLVPAVTCLPAGCGVAEEANTVRILSRTVIVGAATVTTIIVGIFPVLSATRCRIRVGTAVTEILLC